MNLTWDLSDLFQDDNAFYQEINHIKKLVSDIKTFKTIVLDENTLFDLLEKEWNIREKVNHILIYGSLRYYKNIKSDISTKLKEDGESLHNEVTTTLQFIQRKIINLEKNKIETFINKNKKLEIYALYLNQLFRLQKHVQKEEVSEQIKENNDKINEQLALYNKTTKEMQFESIEVDNKTIKLSLSNMNKYLAAKDLETRKKAYFALNKAYQEKEDIFANILNSIYRYRNENASLEQYHSTLEKELYEENIDTKIITSLMDAVHNHLNLFQRYLKIKAKGIGLTKPHYYDFSVPLDSNNQMKYTLEEAIHIIKEALAPLGEEYLETIDFLLQGHIDAEPDENKHQSITFSWYVYSFLNFKGSYGDIKNLIHELGHIVNHYLSDKHLPYIYQDSTVFVGETASIVNEILLSRYMYQNVTSKEEKIFYLSKEIENYFTSVLKQTMYTELEQDLNDTILTNDFTPELLSQKYKDLLQKYYGNDIIYDEIGNIEWTRLGHLYRWSYYSYHYATGLIIASVIVNNLLDIKSLSKEQYIEFLSAGSSKYPLDLLQILQIDLTNSNIMENGFKILESDIEKLEQLMNSNV